MIVMIQQEKWLKQRITLARLHLLEWKDNAAQEKQARKLLVDQYYQQKAHLDCKGYPLEWARYLIRHNMDLSELADTNILLRVAMKQRHESENVALEDQIKKEQARA